MPELDHAALADALQNGGDEGRASASRALGIALDRGGVDALAKLCAATHARDVTLASALSLAQRALDVEIGVAYERRKDRRATVHVLAARFEEGGKTWIAIGAARAWGSTRIGAAWPTLDPWAKRLEDNRERVLAWARTPRPDQLRFEVTREVGPRATGVSSAAVASASASSADDDALLAAIVAAPDDDAPRLVYADWLLERGDARGELIALQCGAEATPDVRARVDAMLGASWTAFAGDAAPYTDKRAFERGFPTWVAMTVAAFAKHGERIFSRAPIEQLRVANPRFTAKDLAKLGATPALARVRTLTLAQSSPVVARRPLAALADSPNLGALRRLELMSCGFSADDWEAFLGRLRAPSLEDVTMLYNHSSAAIYRALAQNPTLTRLRRVHEYCARVLDEGSVDDALAELAVSRPSLERLELSQHAHVGDAAIAPFFEGDDGARLRVLALTGCPVGDALAERIASSPRATALEAIDIHNSELTPRGLEALVASPRLAALSRLEITGYDAARWPKAAVDGWARRLLELPASHPLRTVAVPRASEMDGVLRHALSARFSISD